MKRLLVFVFIVCVFGRCSKNKPPEINTIPISNITGISANSGGEIISNGGSEIISKGICWSTTETPTLDDNNSKSNSVDGNFISTLNDLNYNTTYYVRAYATNDNGTGYGEEISFQTLSVVIIPDENFEQALIDLGYDDVIDSTLEYDNVKNVFVLNLDQKGIYDLTGIDGFSSLDSLYCNSNNLSYINLSKNNQIRFINCENNFEYDSIKFNQNLSTIIVGALKFDSLDLSNYNNLSYLKIKEIENTEDSYLKYLNLGGCNSLENLQLIGYSQNAPWDQTSPTELKITDCINLKHINLRNLHFSVIDFTNFIHLETLSLSSIDQRGLNLSNNSNLTLLNIYLDLTCLNLKNGNNQNLNIFGYSSAYYPNLNCVEVDDVSHANQNWSSIFQNSNLSFSTNCNYPADCF